MSHHALKGKVNKMSDTWRDDTRCKMSQQAAKRFDIDELLAIITFLPHWDVGLCLHEMLNSQ
jgi:hypothetical protein